MNRHRRHSIAGGAPELQRMAGLLDEIHPGWAQCFAAGDFSRLDRASLLDLWSYLTNLHHNLSLFVPARDPDYGISERGGDAILGYLRNRDLSGTYLFFADVSGFTALLTFLTERFGKEEAGDIMNLGILNRFCLDKMGLILEHYRDEHANLDRGLAALKVMLLIRATMPIVTREVKAELKVKLAGKPRQAEIASFIDKLVVKASGGLIFDPEPGSGFYGSRVRARITWGDAARRVALAEKLGGNDDPVSPDEPEVKGIGIDEKVRSRLDALLESGWLGLKRSDLVLSKQKDGFCKLVIREQGMKLLAAAATEICAKGAPLPGAPPDELREMDHDGLGALVESQADRIAAVEPFLTSNGLAEYLVRRLGPEANRNILLDESCSSVRDSGVLFCNFSLQETDVLGQLADEVHGIMDRFGVHYKYNIFPRGHFNLMGVLGTEFSHRKGSEMYFAEILWNVWRDLLARLNHTFGDIVDLRGGMSVGKALQGPAGDNIINNEETIIGPDCNLAARLVGEALVVDRAGNFVYPSGTLFTVDAQRRKVEHLVQPEPPLRKVSLKGFSAPVDLYGLRERSEVESVAEFIGRLRRYPLVTPEGRVVSGEADMRSTPRMARMLKVLEEVPSRTHRRASLISLVAASGVGKTRRIAEVAHWALERGWTVFFGECYSWYQGAGPGTGEIDRDSPVVETHSDEGAYPYFPFIKILKEQVFGITGHDKPAMIREKIAGVLGALDGAGENIGEQAPVIASFLGLDIPETGYSMSLDAEQRRNLFYQRTADIFTVMSNRALAKNGCVMLCIDDLQWSDRNSLHLLSFILRRAGAGLVAVVNARRYSQLGVLRDKSLPVERFLFRPGLLKPEAVRTLSAIVLGIDQKRAGEELPAEMRRRVEEELESNPFFIIEFCSKLVEQELITVSDGRCTRFDADNFEKVSIPTKIQGVIEERIGRLSSDEHAAIRYSSVLGNILRYMIIRRFLPQADSGKQFAGKDLEEIFSHLTGKEITRLENEKDPDWVYTFKRALIGEKLYQELVPTLRKRLHSQVARTFEDAELSNSFEKALLTALHYSHAEVPDKAAEFYLEAGKLARQIYDNDKSLMLFGRAEELLDEYEVSGSREKRTILSLERGQVRLLLGQYGPALEDFQRLEQLANETGVIKLAARAIHFQGQTVYQRAQPGDFELAVQLFSRAERALGESDPRLLAEILNERARAHMELGQTALATEHIDLAEQTFRMVPGGPAELEGRIFLATLLRNRGGISARAGRMDEAIETYDFALSLVDDESEERLRKIRATLYNSRGLALSRAFHLEEALSWYKKALDIAVQIGDARTEIMVRINIGVVDNDSGRNAQALEMLSSEHDRLEVLTGPTRELAALKFNIGESYMFMERFDEAEPWYRQALDIGEKIGYQEFVVGTRYNLAELLHTLDRRDEALAVLLPADKMAREGGWNMLAMDIDNLLGEIYREKKDYANARRFHDSALELSGRLSDIFGRSWALRNVAVDIMDDPESTVAERRDCLSRLAESLELARKAGQPENLMYSLRSLLEWKIEFESGKLKEAAPLHKELRETAEKVGSGAFGEFCESTNHYFKR